MSIIRLRSGDDIEIQLSVKEALEVFATMAQPTGFVQVTGNDGPMYVRPQDVIAIFPDQQRKDTGFQISSPKPHVSKS